MVLHIHKTQKRKNTKLSTTRKNAAKTAKYKNAKKWQNGKKRQKTQKRQNTKTQKRKEGAAARL